MSFFEGFFGGLFGGGGLGFGGNLFGSKIFGNQNSTPIEWEDGQPKAVEETQTPAYLWPDGSYKSYPEGAQSQMQPQSQPLMQPQSQPLMQPQSQPLMQPQSTPMSANTQSPVSQDSGRTFADYLSQPSRGSRLNRAPGALNKDVPAYQLGESNQAYEGRLQAAGLMSKPQQQSQPLMPQQQSHPLMPQQQRQPLMQPQSQPLMQPRSQPLMPPKEASQMPYAGIQTHGEQAPTEIIFHHTGGPTVKSAVDTLQARKLGYHYIIDKDGGVTQLADPGQRVYHARGHSKNTIGISFVGGGKFGGATPEQHRAAVQLSKQLAAKYGIKSVAGHKHRSNHGKPDPDGFDFNWFHQQTGLPLGF